LIFTCDCIIVPPGGGKVVVQEVAGTATALWPTAELEYALEVTLTSGRVVTWLKGKQPILKDITR
jgi:hypothetical protein